MPHQTEPTKELPDDLWDQVVALQGRRQQAEKRGYDQAYLNKKLGYGGYWRSSVYFTMSALSAELSPHHEDLFSLVGIGVCEALYRLQKRVTPIVQQFQFNRKTIVSRRKPAPNNDSRALDVEIYAISKDYCRGEEKTWAYRNTPNRWRQQQEKLRAFAEKGDHPAP